jgi:uncharacterized RDD family membrane protein YckC
LPRFDEIELRKGHEEATPEELPPEEAPPERTTAPLWKRAAALIVDLSLFVAAGIAMAPLLPEGTGALGAPLLAVVAFLLLVSLYYFCLGWMVWGKTVGGAILDIRIVGENRRDVNLRSALRRWSGMALSLVTLGAGFLPALFRDRRSLADRLSNTRAVRGGA